MRQDESSLVNFRVVVTEELIFFFLGERTKGFLDVGVRILGTHDVTNLTTGVSGDASVSIFNLGVDVLTEVLDLSDERKMEPHTFTLGGEDTLFGKSVLQKLEEVRTEERFSGTIGIRRVSDDNIILVDLVLQEFETVTNVKGDLGVFETNRHVGEVLLGDTRNSFVNIDKSGFFNTLVLDNFTKNTTVTTTNDKNLYIIDRLISILSPFFFSLSLYYIYLLGTRVRVHGKMSDHFLVAMIEYVEFSIPL